MSRSAAFAALVVVALSGLTLAALRAASAQSSAAVSVLYAGSLVTPMEGPIKAQLAMEGIDFQGEAGGSKMLSNLIATGSKNPDVFISVDPQLVARLHDKVADATTFAHTSLGIAWSNQSRFAPLFAQAAAGKLPLLRVLTTPGLTIGRTDPRLDPKGAYTIAAMMMMAGGEAERQILGADQNPAQTFPEEDLLVRIETGQADVGFFYEVEAKARGLNFLALPGTAAMSDKVTYTLAVMQHAPHPATAATVRTFILRGEGRRILTQAGLTYFAVPKALPITPCRPPCTL